MPTFKEIRGLDLFLFLFAFLLLPTQLVAQNFAFPIGANLTSEAGSTMTIGPSGDYYLGGNLEGDGLLCRITNTGELVWTKAIEFGDEADYILDLHITSDNFLIGSGNCRDAAGFNAYSYAFKRKFNLEQKIDSSHGIYLGIWYRGRNKW